MIALPEYENYDGLGSAERVRKREILPEDLLEAAVERIEARNPTVNAVVHKMYDEARACLAAGLTDGAFTGVPFLLKDLCTFCKGAPGGSGSAPWNGNVADEDSDMARRYRPAGRVMVERTNTPEFGLSVTAGPAACGPTRNPSGEGWAGLLSITRCRAACATERPRACFLKSESGSGGSDLRKHAPMSGVERIHAFYPDREVIRIKGDPL